MYSILSGKKPFESKTHLESRQKDPLGHSPLLGDLRKDIPPALASAIARAMEKEPRAPLRGRAGVP